MSVIKVFSIFRIMKENFLLGVYNKMNLEIEGKNVITITN